MVYICLWGELDITYFYKNIKRTKFFNKDFYEITST